MSVNSEAAPAAEGEPLAASTAPLTFSDFLDKMRQPGAAELGACVLAAARKSAARPRFATRRPQRRTRGVEAPLRAVRHPACVFGSMGDVLRRRNSTHNKQSCHLPKAQKRPADCVSTPLRPL